MTGWVHLAATAVASTSTAASTSAATAAVAALVVGPVVVWLVGFHRLHPARLGGPAATDTTTTGTATGSAAGIAAGVTVGVATGVTVAATGVLAAVLASAGQPAGAGGPARAATGVGVGVVAVPLLVFGLPAAIVDIYEQRLPDALTRPLLATTLLAITAAAASTGEWQVWVRALLVAAAVTAAAVVVKRLHTVAIGWGDIKFLPSLGVVLGWAGWHATAGAAMLWAILVPLTAAVLAMSDHADGRPGMVPYGPALLAGTAAALTIST
jgi:prepilin signal peptidase PulO-like enzyme (type II secretory pathway)